MAVSAREFFYATPTVAHGRVYIGNTDGTMYVFGAKTGRLLWARPLGTYIYGAAAVYKRKVFVGHLRRPVLRAECGHGRHRLADRSRRHGPRGADRNGRPRLLRDLLDLRIRGLARGGRRHGRDLRGARQERQARVAVQTAASTRIRWWRTPSASTSRGARSSSPSPRRDRRPRGRTRSETGGWRSANGSASAPSASDLTRVRVDRAHGWMPPPSAQRPRRPSSATPGSSC